MSLSKAIIKLSAGLIFGLSGITFPLLAANAQTGQPQLQEGFVYTVQPGDTLVSIALRYNLSLTNIILTNNLSNLNLIFPGQRLLLPGVATPHNPGTVLGSPGSNPTHIVQPGETLFTIANKYGVLMEAVIQANSILNPDVIQVGQALQVPVGPTPVPPPLPAPFVSADLSEPIIIQGRTLIVKVKLTPPAALTGNFDGRPILFVDGGAGQYWGIAAIHAMVEPKVYPITLTATTPDSRQTSTVINVTVVEGPYNSESIEVDEQRGQLLDQQLLESEQQKLDNLWSQISSRPRWQGPFRYPVEFSSLRITSNFGTRRSYNGSPVASFHGGTDFGGEVGMSIYAAAAGTVIMAEKLTVRGNAVLIDHGLGLFSGYWHLSGLAVPAGQEVKPGDLIGYLGDTGLVTGPHLHWEMRLNGIAVEPLQWVQQNIP
jgi:murein DD-endopeptidase MepM/ murein hydrolase activator NlpD